MRSQTILIILIIVLVLVQLNSYAGGGEKDRYTEDAIDVSGKVYKILINPDSEKVVLFWSDESKGWIDVAQCPVDLNKEYQDRKTMRDMQEELNRMRDESWDDRYHGIMTSH